MPKLIEDASDTITYQRAARNVGLAWHYLVQESRLFGNILQLDRVEIVYRGEGELHILFWGLSFWSHSILVYNGHGQVLETPVNVLIPEAYPNKKFRVSDFVPGGITVNYNFFDILC